MSGGRVRGQTFTSGVTTSYAAARAAQIHHNHHTHPSSTAIATQQPAASPAATASYSKHSLALLSPKDLAAAEAAQARIAALEEELATHQRAVGELSKHIFEKNHEYIRTEEMLCERIAQFNRESAQREKAAPTPSEQRLFSERLRRASQLQDEIHQGELRLAASDRERTLAETSSRRLNHHVQAMEDAVTKHADELETLTQTLLSLAVVTVAATPDEGTSSRNEEDGGHLHDEDGVVGNRKRNNDLSSAAAVVDVDESLSILQDSLLERIAPAFRERCPLQCAARVLMGRADWLSHRFVQTLEHEAHMFKKRDNDLHVATQRTEERLTQHAALLQEAQSALIEIHKDVQERRDRLEQLQRKCSHMESELAAAAKQVPPSVKQIATTEAAIVDLESELTTLSLDAARESERAALQRTETSLAAARAEQSQEAIDEATEILTNKKSSLKELEQESSELSRRHFQLEEQNAQAEMQVTRLTAELAAVQEELRFAEARLASAGTDDTEVTRQWRQLERELDGLRAARETARQRLELKTADREALERNLAQSREERASLRRDIMNAQAKRTDLARREQETIRELQYVQQLLPKSHPSAKLSRKLQDRISWEPLENDEMAAMAVAKRDELIASAKKGQQKRVEFGSGGAGGVSPVAGGSSSTVAVPLMYDDEHFVAPIVNRGSRTQPQPIFGDHQSGSQSAQHPPPPQQPVYSRTPTPTPLATPHVDALVPPPSSLARIAEPAWLAGNPQNNNNNNNPSPRPTTNSSSNVVVGGGVSHHPLAEMFSLRSSSFESVVPTAEANHDYHRTTYYDAPPSSSLATQQQRLPSSSVLTDTTVTSAPPSVLSAAMMDLPSSYVPTTSSHVTAAARQHNRQPQTTPPMEDGLSGSSSAWHHHQYDDSHHLRQPMSSSIFLQQAAEAAVPPSSRQVSFSPPPPPRSISATSTSTHTSSIAEINEKLNEIMNRRRRP
ncbi:Hypothetical protein, putative [Bodo saltans]|uniref:Uncharacterized protein n=1 Tax=Bodo saltans TaxID=75058 RepID=A0A0S4IXC0_BODSA|nr:Hypothetical protein, putative [Bodo saltans]|eukprot:CUG38549.1 Hypothetical protein, putative [Bodo saltans]